MEKSTVVVVRSTRGATPGAGLTGTAASILAEEGDRRLQEEAAWWVGRCGLDWAVGVGSVGLGTGSVEEHGAEKRREIESKTWAWCGRAGSMTVLGHKGGHDGGQCTGAEGQQLF
ncbi:hypothetical protein M0R45_002169 [Rubus argutus]|uniref:Uncharacterized protein n=1 Tax=Rubus argutus TaxID=59490 RepID=A0AAW1VDP3_RUBAR